MAALTAGSEAPDFALPTTEGQPFSLSEALQKGPILLVFSKTNCQVCRYTFPFLERLDTSYSERGLTVLAVSQSSAPDTDRFQKETGVSFPAVLDEPTGYQVSNAYGVTNTPTLFLVIQDGTVAVSSLGWSRDDVTSINNRIAESLSSAVAPVFRPEEQVAGWRPG